MFTGPLAPLPTYAVDEGHLFESAWAKYNHATEHYARLRAAAHTLLSATSRDGRIEQQEGDKNTNAFVARVPAVPLRLACIVGDVAHCLRTSLDHAAWTLARLNGWTGNSRKVKFPICESPSEYKRPRIAAIMGDRAADALERLQPFHDRQGLLWLQDLNNVDKHEVVVEVRHRFILRDLQLLVKATGEPLQRPASEPLPIDLVNGQTVLTLTKAPHARWDDVHLKTEFQNTYAFALAADRSWPRDRVDLVLRQTFHDVEACLLDLSEKFATLPTLTPP